MRTGGPRKAFVIALLAVASVLLGTAAKADPCPTACDEACGSCCTRWQIRPRCAAGDGTEEGTYRSFDDARAAAAARDKCAPDDAECARRRLVCVGDTPATSWAPYCDSARRYSPADQAPVMKALHETAGLITSAIQRVAAAQKDLVTFATTRTVRDKGVARASGAADALRVAGRRLRALDDRRKELLLGASPAEASALGEQVTFAIREANTATELTAAVLADRSLVDTTAEDRERAALAAAHAREEEIARAQAQRAAAEDARKRAQDEAAARRAEAEAQRQAAEEASARKRQEQASQQASLASATAAEKRQRAEQKRAATTQSLADADAILGPLLAAAVDTLSVANLPPAERERAQQSRQRLQAMQVRVRDLRTRTAAAAQRAPGDAIELLSRAELDTAALLAETRAIVGARAPSSKESTSVPSCLLGLVPAPGLDGATVAVDGGKPVSLPTKLRVSSGRHALVVAQGGRTHRQSELLVCGRIETLTLGLPR